MGGGPRLPPTKAATHPGKACPSPRDSSHFWSSREPDSVLSTQITGSCQTCLPEGAGLEPGGSPPGSQRGSNRARWTEAPPGQADPRGGLAVPQAGLNSSSAVSEPQAWRAAEQLAGPARVSCNPPALPPPEGRPPASRVGGGAGRWAPHMLRREGGVTTPSHRWGAAPAPRSPPTLSPRVPSQQQQEKKTRLSKQRREQASFKPTTERQQRSGLPRELPGAWAPSGGAGHRLPAPTALPGPEEGSGQQHLPWDPLVQEGSGPGPRR